MGRVAVIAGGEYSRVLESEGHVVISFGSEGEIVSAAVERRFDVALVDLDTATPRQAGLLSSLRQACPDLSILAMGRYVDPETVSECIRNGVADFLRIPCTPGALARAVGNALSAKALREEAAAYRSDLKSTLDEMTKQLIHAERLATTGILTAEILHEIKNQISLISIATQTVEFLVPELKRLFEAEEEPPEASDQKLVFLRELDNALPSIKSGIGKCLKIVSRVGRYTSMMQSSDATCDLNECVGAALDLCRGRLIGTAECATELADDLPGVPCDHQLVEQVLVNILLNAADAVETNGGGTIRWRTWRDGSSVCVRISDDGPGIAPGQLDRIWEPFFTTKPHGKGSGLGLSVAKRIVEQLGGTVRAGKAAEGGAEFTITFPVKEDPIETASPGC